MGSPAIAGRVAHLVFWALLALGVVFGEMPAKWATVFVLLWLAGYFGLLHVSPLGGLFVAPYVAVLDVVLALVVLKGDVRLT
jgi:hypothetical protein